MKEGKSALRDVLRWLLDDDEEEDDESDDEEGKVSRSSTCHEESHSYTQF